MANQWFDDSITPVFDGYDRSIQSPFIRTNMSNGRGINRRIYTSVPEFITAKIVCPVGLARVFEAWFQASTGAGDGVLWFDCPVSLPTGHVEHEARFTDMWRPGIRGLTHWEYILPLELRDRASFTGDDYDADPNLIRYADQLDIAINQEWPSE